MTEIKKRLDRHATTQYIINDGYDFSITEVLGGEDYNVAFVYVEEGYENPDVPVWAIKLVLQPDDIRGI